MTKDAAAMSAPSAGYGRPHFIQRQKLCELSSGMRERAEWARAAAVENPAAVDVDDEMLPWVYNEAEGMWFSFDGNYSALSPAEKWERKVERDAKLADEEAAYQRWSAIRQQVLQRDGYTCQLCGFLATSNLHIHHILKRTDGGTDHLDNLLTLCPSCHSKADRKFYNPDWTQPPVE